MDRLLFRKKFPGLKKYSVLARLPYVIPYDPAFLGDGFQVPLPVPACGGRLYQSGRVFDYIHFSLVMHQDRRMALFTAHNVDIARLRQASGTNWDLDMRIERSAQTGPEAYLNNPWDRGHLVRRAAVVWGTEGEAKDASDSTFHYTNASLQHEKFNQDEWLALEDWVLQAAGGISSRLCVFTGPIYTRQDVFFQEFRIPSAFWKVVVLRDPADAGQDLAALGFLMKQNEMWDDWNGATLLNLRLYQVGIPEIGAYAGLDFGLLAQLDEFEWRQPRFRDRSRYRPIPIDGPEDIKFFGDRRRALGIRALRIGRPAEGASAPVETGQAGPCACGGKSDGLQTQIDALGEQLRALQGVIDGMLESMPEQEEMEVFCKQYQRIVGGAMTLPGEFPECACIGDNGGWFCSGVLIHERVVLTAAHCAPEINRVYLGGRSLNLIGTSGEVIRVERVVIHPEYDPDRVPSHDIALIVLETPARTMPVALASALEVEAEDNVTLVGFGYDHPTSPTGFGTKRKVDVPLTNLQGMDAGAIDQLERTHGFDGEFEFHAGRKQLGKDSCNGDSGGPAYITAGDAFKVAGLTSRAAFSSVLPCGDGGIYTRITPYLGWLYEASGALVGEEEGAPKAMADKLYISAAQPNPEGADRGAEWIEITNAGRIDVILKGYAVADRQGGRIPVSGPLSAGKTCRVVLKEDAPVKLANPGDDIILLRGEDVVHRVSYDAAASGETLHFGSPYGDGKDCGDGLLPGADPC